MPGGLHPFLRPDLAAGSPYAERAEHEARWHDQWAETLLSWTWWPLRQALSLQRRDMRRVARGVLAASPALAALSDAALQTRGAAAGRRLRRVGLAEGAVIEAFAVIREASRRTLGLAHFETQLMAGHGLLRGRLVEMATGEGKTLCATLPACAVALAGYPVHVITVNDYLAERDAARLKPLYDFLGLSVGVVLQGQPRPQRREAYACDITYGTNKEVAFDYLRDRVALKGQGSRLQQAVRGLAGRPEGDDGLVMRGLYFAVVDEADSVFVDEARTPLILSASRGGDNEGADCLTALAFASELTEGVDYRVHHQEQRVFLTDHGRERLDRQAEFWAGTHGASWSSSRVREERLRQALSAIHLYRRDEQYVVADGKVQIVDESTGRLMPDRSWERGLHQMIEAKEGVATSSRRETLARLTYQRLFRRYLHLSGMTGTAAEAGREIRLVYGLDVVSVPLHRPSRRRHLPARFVASLHEKWQAVADRAEQLSRVEGRPVLIGTRSVRASEQISAVLRERGLEHALLNAKQDVIEAEVVARAGGHGRVTVATNMAGRGTDIELGPGVEALGGLHVILTEYHDSHRVDRQLFGRCARQGDPGSCEAIVSLEDEVFTVGVPGPTAWLRRALLAGMPLPAAALGLLRRLAQWSAERRHAELRVHNLKQDGQLNRSLAFTGKGE